MPQPIRGLAAPEGEPSLAGISCTSAGNCLAAGNYEPVHFPIQFLTGSHAAAAREVNGAWGPAVPIPGLAALSHGGSSGITQVSCSQTGWCVLVGRFWPTNGSAYSGTPFVTSEHDGAWRPAQLIPGLATSSGSAPSIGPLACDPEGSCTLAGAQQGSGAFVVTEANGAWSRPQHINGDIGELSCTSPGNCSGVGNYYPPAYSHEWYGLSPRVITETNGRWGRAAPLPGTVRFRAITPGGSDGAFATDVVAGLSCTAPGQCVLVGYYASLYNGEYSGVNAAVPFIASQVNGTWNAPREIPGPGAHGHAGIVEITALSCGSAGNCVAGGSYTYERVNLGTSDGTVYPQAFLMTETNGVWGPAEEVPGLRALGPKESEIDFISCAATGMGHSSTAGRVPGSDGGCTALGGYNKKTGTPEPGAFGLFTTSQG
jgi:hypothetical protein